MADYDQQIMTHKHQMSILSNIQELHLIYCTSESRVQAYIDYVIFMYMGSCVSAWATVYTT